MSRRAIARALAITLVCAASPVLAQDIPGPQRIDQPVPQQANTSSWKPSLPGWGDVALFLIHPAGGVVGFIRQYAMSQATDAVVEATPPLKDAQQAVQQTVLQAVVPPLSSVLEGPMSAAMDAMPERAKGALVDLSGVSPGAPVNALPAPVDVPTPTTPIEGAPAVPQTGSAGNEPAPSNAAQPILPISSQEIPTTAWWEFAAPTQTDVGVTSPSAGGYDKTAGAALGQQTKNPLLDFVPVDSNSPGSDHDDNSWPSVQFNTGGSSWFDSSSNSFNWDSFN